LPPTKSYERGAGIHGLAPVIDELGPVFWWDLQPFNEETLMLLTVKTSPWWLSALLALGSFGVGRFAYQTLSVVLQTFILPGTSVRPNTVQSTVILTNFV
jgi:hypothetical protein